MPTPGCVKLWGWMKKKCPKKKIRSNTTDYLQDIKFRRST
jgi:hypothetical protein